MPYKSFAFDISKTFEDVYSKLDSGGGDGVSADYVDDKILKLMAWTNFIGYIGTIDPATQPEEKAGFYIGTRWYKGDISTDNTFLGFQWLGDSLGWEPITNWVTEPQDVASWLWTDYTSANNRYAVLAFEQWSNVNTINPLEKEN